MHRTAVLTLLTCGIMSLPAAGAATAQEVGRWRISATPEVMIGLVEGDEDYLFTSVQGAAFLPDGRIAVADRGTSSVRIYRPDGSLDIEMGGEGEGPGEFRLVAGMKVIPPDSIRVWDFGIVRVTTFLADGTPVGSQRFNPAEPRGPGGALDGLVGFFGDGDVLLHWTVGPAGGSEGRPPTG